MPENKRKMNVLFVCTGNSCRSQMAEGWARHLKSNVMEAFSAGIRPIGVNSRAVRVMAEAGVDISRQTSSRIDDSAAIDFDYVVTLCDNAKQQCPVFPGEAKLVHRAFSDPYFASGTEEEIMDAFRRTRDEIRKFVENMPDNLAELAKASSKQ
ncbi:MAG TPA: arsenate reductase ArsC [Sedimentisphaerales bacterium]|nr:arsenate reductase ArsC [Sedimentisphaerales bacterium]